MRSLYTLLLYLSTPFILLRLLWRSIRLPAYRQRWGERFGFFPTLPPTPTIWVHAVSVGEIQAAIPLIRALLQQYTDYLILVTTTTPTGSQRVREIFNDPVWHVYLPYDLPGSLQRFLKRTHPKLLILMETELWPNLLYFCQKRAIPVILANARLSAQSASGYQQLRGLTKEMLEKLSVIAVQTSADANRFLSLGAKPTQIQIMGNLKFDLELPTDLLIKANHLRQTFGTERFVWIAASTHHGEETLILDVFQLLMKEIPHLLLILVPRHPDRFNQVATLCYQRKLTTVRRSQGETCTATTEVYLGDTLGELLFLYAASDVAFVGGSLVPVGGHNLLEPAAIGLPIITGPYMFNFAYITQQLFKVDAIQQVVRSDELVEAVLMLFRDPQCRQEMGQQAQALVARNRGALMKLLTIVHSHIPEKIVNSSC